MISHLRRSVGFSAMSSSSSFTDLDFREEYVDGAEYLLKHEEDTHVEGQVLQSSKTLAENVKLKT